MSIHVSLSFVLYCNGERARQSGGALKEAGRRDEMRRLDISGRVSAYGGAATV